MQRVIKFRFRYTDGKDWIMQSFTLEQCLNGEPFDVLSDQPLLKNYRMEGRDEFTGLHDKTGNEIYEGDVNQDLGVLIWNSDDASFCWDYKGIEVMPMGGESGWCEIIGNIYETPELIHQGN